MDYLPYPKQLKVPPLRVASAQNISGDISRKAMDEFFKEAGISKKRFFTRATEVWKTALIENWRSGNPATRFPEDWGDFETVNEIELDAGCLEAI